MIGETQAFSPVSVSKDEKTAKRQGGIPSLEILSGPYAGERFEMAEGSFTLGRDPKCDIFLSNMTVSRHHATITIDDSGARIVDAGSLNGTWVDGAVVDEAPLQAGSHVQIGTFEMMFKYSDD